MSVDSKIIEVISNETKDTISKMGVVTPSIYASIFTKFAQEHNQNLDDEEELSHNLLKTECNTLLKMQNSTTESANKLSLSTDKAITAIKDKDETTLNEVLKETNLLRKELEKLKEAVYKDELTLTFNRKWLHDNYLDEEKDSFTKSGTLAMIDLNYFKIINDTYGHIIGDKVLIFIANHLKMTKYDVVRYGGDEFIVIFPPEVVVSQAKELLEQLREKVSSTKLKAHKKEFITSFSLGIVSFKKGDILAEVIDNADKNMYEDKLEIKKRIKGIDV